jgi:hypothetical protein
VRRARSRRRLLQDDGEPRAPRRHAAVRPCDAARRAGGPPSQLDAAALAAGASFTFAPDHGTLDILGDPARAPGHAALRREATVVELATMSIRTASLDHLTA